MSRRNLELQHSKKRQPPREPSEWDGIDRSVAPPGPWTTGPLGVSADEEPLSNWTHKDEAFFVSPKQYEALLKRLEEYSKPKSVVSAPGALSFVSAPGALSFVAKARPTTSRFVWSPMSPLIVPPPRVLLPTLEIREDDMLDRISRYVTKLPLRSLPYGYLVDDTPRDDRVDALKYAMESVRQGKTLNLIKEKP